MYQPLMSRAKLALPVPSQPIFGFIVLTTLLIVVDSMFITAHWFWANAVLRPNAKSEFLVWLQLTLWVIGAVLFCFTLTVGVTVGIAIHVRHRVFLLTCLAWYVTASTFFALEMYMIPRIAHDPKDWLDLWLMIAEITCACWIPDIPIAALGYLVYTQIA
jgi:hypothetical protein